MSSDAAARSCHRAVRDWILWLIQNCCFSPEEYDRPWSSDSNIKCYVSCPGTMEGGVMESPGVKNILRFTPSNRGSKPPLQMIAEMIAKEFGGELARFCHVNSEICILERMLDKLMSFKMDLRPILFNAPVFNTRKHIKKLGLEGDLPGLCRQGYDKPDCFLKMGVWKTGGGAVGSEGASVNMWALLTAASLVGSNHIHCKSSSRISQSLLALILESAPAAVTPGNVVPVRSFDEVSGSLEMVQVQCYRRPENFLRPVNDVNFAINGVFSYCPVEDGEMPEDYLGFGHVRAQAKFLKCKYMEVPPQHIMGSYQILPGRYYCVYNHATKCVGNVFVGDKKVRIELREDGELLDADFDKWEEHLTARSYLVLPTIFRSGAVVTLEDDDEGVGCLVTDGTRKSMGFVPSDFYLSNYDHLGYCYHALTAEEELETITADKIYQRLVNPGADLWIRPDTQTWAELQKYFPKNEALGPEREALRMVKARLNVSLVSNPDPRKVCVTVIYKKLHGLQTVDLEIQHLSLYPWELSRKAPEDPCLQVHDLVA